MALLNGKSQLARLFAIAAVLMHAAAAIGSSPEYQVKAAFLYNFAKFVEWPEQQSSAPVTICVLGQDPFGAVLDETVQGKRINGRALAVLRRSDAGGLKGCSIAFISSSEGRRLPAIVKAAESAGTLTVGEAEGFSPRGGIIGFVLEDNKIRFQINVDAATRARIRINSQLLQLSHVVHDDSGREK